MPTLKTLGCCQRATHSCAPINTPQTKTIWSETVEDKDRFERLQAAIAEHKRRWTEKYGWVPREECRYPTMEEEERRKVEAGWTREANACIRMHITNGDRTAASETKAAD
jgi:hypothetical protein